MAQRGRPISAFTLARLLRLRAHGLGIRALARELNLDRWTVRKYLAGAAWCGRPLRKAA